MDSGSAPSGASTMCNCTSGNDGKNQLRLALPWEEPNSFFKSLMPSESRGQSQENECFAQFATFVRGRISFTAACGLLGASTGRGTFSFKEACCSSCCCFT